MAVDPTPKQKKQCFCEPEAKVLPAHCADDGDDCLCNGLVYYMKKGTTPASAEDFSRGLKENYTVQKANDTEKIPCGKKTFEGVNMLPGEEKMCMCDEDQSTMEDETVEKVKAYWRTQADQLLIKEKEVALALAEAKAHVKMIAEEENKQELLKIRITAQKVAEQILAKEAAAENALEEERAKKEREEEKKERDKAGADAAKKLAEGEAAHKKAQDEIQKARDAKAKALKETNEEKKNKMVEAAEKAEKIAVADGLKAAKKAKEAEHAKEIVALGEK